MKADLNIEDEIFETTYQIVIGDMSVEILLNKKPTTHLLYNPFELTYKDFLLLIDNLIEHYIYKEEYLKCANLRDIKAAEGDHDNILNDIVLDAYEEDYEFYPDTDPEISPLGTLIDTMKNINPRIFTDGFKNYIKSESIDDITDAEMWAIMSAEDKGIFKDSFADFFKWVDGLSEPIRDVYIDRLLDDKPLIPEDNIKDKMKEEYIDDDIEFTDEQDNIDYVNNVVISFMDKYTIMSHTNLVKLKEIRASLIMHGILDVEFRKKGDVHSIVYRSSQKPQKPNLN